MNTIRLKTMRPSLLVLATLSTLGMLGSAHATDDGETSALSRAQSWVDVGAGNVSQQNTRFGRFSGLTDSGGYGLLDVYWLMRDDASGRWLKLDARSLGLDSRSVRLESVVQGNWGVSIDYNQTPANSPYRANTRLAGIGSGTQVVGGEALARDVSLRTEREALSLGVEKYLPAGFDWQVRYRNEDKTGSRLFGRSSGDFLAEPIDYTTRQVETILGYVGKRLQLSAGYYASRYENGVTALFATGGSGSAFSPIALPPANQAHQWYLSGAYAFTPTTRATFKVSMGRMRQDDSYIVAPTATPNITGRSALNGRIDTSLYQIGITSRPLPKLSLLANFRLEDRDDKTPSQRYGLAPTAGATFDGLYEPRSIESRNSKVEASYQLPMGYRVIGSAEVDEKVRFVPAGPLVTVATREKAEETSYRLELRRALSENINGTLAIIKSERGGSPLLTSRGFINGLPTSSLVGPFHLADRERNKWRLTLDWSPLEMLSLQAMAEHADDSYSGRPMGLKSGEARHYAFDAALSLSDHWSLHAWISRNDSSGYQVSQTCTTSALSVCTVVGQVWTAKLDSVGDAWGVGLRGKARQWQELGVDLNQSKDRSVYGATVIYPVGVTAPPDTHYTVTRLKLFGRYALQKKLSLRAEYVYERCRTDDWTWTNYVSADGTRVLQDPNQKVQFVGLSLRYAF